MTTVGTGKYTYELVENWAKLPAGETFAMVSAVATDSQDRVYAFQRKDPPIVIFDRDGKYISSWGNGNFEFAHGIHIADDVVYLTDRNSSTCIIYTLDGRPIQMLGRHGVHSDTGCEVPAELVPRAAGPFNYPSELVPGPDGGLCPTVTAMLAYTGSAAAVSSRYRGASRARLPPTSFTCPIAWWSRATGFTFATGRTTACRSFPPTANTWPFGKTSNVPWTFPWTPMAIS